MQKKKIFTIAGVALAISTLAQLLDAFVYGDAIRHYLCPSGGLFECFGVGFVILFWFIIVIPLLFGIFGFFIERESRFKKALIYFGISLLAAILVQIVAYQVYYIFIGRAQQQNLAQEDQAIEQARKERSDIWFIKPSENESENSPIDPHIPFTVEAEVKVVAIPADGTLTATLQVGKNTILATTKLFPTADPVTDGRKLFRGTMPATSVTSYTPGTGAIRVKGTGPVIYGPTVTIR